MLKNINISSIFFILLFSGTVSAQSSPFDKTVTNERQNVNEGTLSERELDRRLQDLRMELEYMIMENSAPDLGEEDSDGNSLLDSLGEDAKTKVVINGKTLIRDSEKYSIQSN